MSKRKVDANGNSAKQIITPQRVFLREKKPLVVLKHPGGNYSKNVFNKEQKYYVGDLLKGCHYSVK